MSYTLETINRGKVDGFGYHGPLITSVALGDIPRIPLDQFCDFGVKAMIKSWEHFPDGDKGAIIGALTSTEEEIRDFNRLVPKHAKLLEVLTGPIVPYSENPIRVSERCVAIGERYLVDHEQYVYFAKYVLDGGFFGWNNETGVPLPIPGAISRVLRAIA